MSRLFFSVCVFVGLATAAAAADAPRAPKIDWSAWKRIPVLDDGRIKPLDTYAEEKATLITGRAKWTDPKTNRKYSAAELLYGWVTAPKEWQKQPIIRCEYRPLRKLLLGAEKEEGTYIAVDEFLDLETSFKTGKPVFRSDKAEGLLKPIEQASMLGKKDPEEVGNTEADRQLGKKAAELFKHVQTFLAISDARTLYVVPGIDPRTLTKQFDPDSEVRPWVSLGSLLHLDDWQDHGDVTVTALMAPNASEMLQAAVPHFVRSGRDGKRVDDRPSLPQLMQALPLQARLRPQLEAVKVALTASREEYDKLNGGDPKEFERALRTFATKVEDLAHGLEEARVAMGPLKEKLPEGIPYEPLELDARQMSLSAYPAAGALDLEIFYNRLQPFYLSCWIFGLAVMPLLASWMLSLMDTSFQSVSRVLYLLGLGFTGVAIALATWGFALRIVIAGRPPVTNMYETVIWVSYVVSVLGFWFATLPFLWPGLQWAWRLTAIPYSWEDTPLTADDERKGLLGLLADYKTPVGAVASLLRLVGFVGLVYVLAMGNTSFRVTSLMPPITAVDTFSLGAVLTWLIGLGTVLTAAWVFPRVVLALLGGVVLVVPEGRRQGAQLWEQTLSRRFFLIGSIPVALFGMLLAYNVGNISPEILNPRIGSITAVLRNNYWLTIHVLTIVSSYGAGALVWGLGNLAMLYYLFGRYRREAVHAGALSEKHRPALQSTGASAPIFDEKQLAGAPKSSDGILSRLKTAGRGLAPGQIKQTFSAGIQNFGTGDTHLEQSRVLPPKDTLTLANFGYKGMQVAVLLLAAGTILGGLWADVSWGRFWDWDPKEVWALISLLVYLVFLHGRYAGWVGTFGTNAGSVLCFQAIVMSWYGVNFVLPKFHGWLNGTGVPTQVGLHSYGSGDGGLIWVATACGLNVLLVVVAWARYVRETILIDKSPSVGSQAPAPEGALKTVEA
jgi:ABC-type transport system involved in cytochrome c biogenesis permease subunit